MCSSFLVTGVFSLLLCVFLLDGSTSVVVVVLSPVVVVLSPCTALLDNIYTVYLYLETAVHVFGGTSTHHQEGIQLYLQSLVFVTLLLLPAVSIYIVHVSVTCISLKMAKMCSSIVL